VSGVCKHDAPWFVLSFSPVNTRQEKEETGEREKGGKIKQQSNRASRSTHIIQQKIDWPRGAPRKNFPQQLIGTINFWPNTFIGHLKSPKMVE